MRVGVGRGVAVRVAAAVAVLVGVADGVGVQVGAGVTVGVCVGSAMSGTGVTVSDARHPTTSSPKRTQDKRYRNRIHRTLRGVE